MSVGRRTMVRRLASGIVPPAASLLFAAGGVAVVGSALLVAHEPPAVPLRPTVSVLQATPSCDALATGITVGWELDPSLPGSPVTGVRLDDVPAACASLPITVSILDAAGAVLRSVTRPGVVNPDTVMVSAEFDFRAHPVPVPPIEGVRADVPDPIDTPAELPPGEDVAVVLADPAAGTLIEVGFAAVEDAGGTLQATAVDPGETGYVAPSGFRLTTPALYYDLAVAASFEPPVQVCLTIPVASVAGGTAPALFHWDRGAARWIDTTTSWDPVSGRVCGTVTSFSPFAVGIVEPRSSPRPTPPVRPSPHAPAKPTPRAPAVPRSSARPGFSPLPSGSGPVGAAPSPAARPSAATGLLNGTPDPSAGLAGRRRLPRISVHSASGALIEHAIPGQSLVVTGSGWAPRCQAHVVLDSPGRMPVELGSGVPGDDGQVVVDVAIPADIDPGIATIRLTGDGSDDGCPSPGPSMTLVVDDSADGVEMLVEAAGGPGGLALAVLVGASLVAGAWYVGSRMGATPTEDR